MTEPEILIRPDSNINNLQLLAVYEELPHTFHLSLAATF